MSTISFDEADLDALAARVAAKVAEALAQRPTPQGDASEWLTAKQTARQLGLAAKTLEAWRRKGRGPKWERAGSRSIRYRRAEVDAFMLRREKK